MQWPDQPGHKPRPHGGTKYKAKDNAFLENASSSRAYPLALEKKAEYYKAMYMHEGLLK